MITKLVGAATLFAAGSLVAGGSTTVAATPVSPFGSENALSQAGDCGSKDAKPDAKGDSKAPAKAKDPKAKGKEAKEGGCGGGGGCGSHDMKKDKKEGSCGKDKKEGSCGKDKKDEKK